MSGSKIRWVDHGASDGYEIKVYEIDNMDSLQRRGKAGNKVICKKNIMLIYHDVIWRICPHSSSVALL